jgi:phosphatidylglycerophosphate synthase
MERMTAPEPINRRQLKTRGRAWPSAIAKGLARAGITPNQVSVLSIVFALGAAGAFARAGAAVTAHPGRWLVTAAVCIQLRLLCNLLDGLLAIEGGLKTKTGDLYNEIPDRVADIAILVGAGYAVKALPLGITLGWATALVAVVTAYVRLLGGSLGFVQDFSGPMAKQHRMFALTLGTLIAAGEIALRGTMSTLHAALWIILAGSILTAMRRTIRIAQQMESR